MWNVPLKNTSQRNNCLWVLSNKVTPTFAPSKFDGKISDRRYLYFDHVRSSRSDDVVSKFLNTIKYRVCAYSIYDAFAWQRPIYWSSISNYWSRKLRIVQIVCKPNTFKPAVFLYCINSIPWNKFSQTNILAATRNRRRTSCGISVNVNEKKYNTVCT